MVQLKTTSDENIMTPTIAEVQSKKSKKSKKVKADVEEEDSGISDELPKKVKKSKKDKVKNEETPKKKKKRKLEEPEDEEISNKKAKTGKLVRKPFSDVLYRGHHIRP